MADTRAEVLVGRERLEDASARALATLEGSVVAPPAELNVVERQSEEHDNGRERNGGGEGRRQNEVVLENELA